MLFRPVLPGATFGIVSPASPIQEGELEPGLAGLHALGFRTKLMPNVRATHGHLAGTDEARIHDLHAAFFDPEVDAVLCSRGGYGAARLLPKLDLDGIARTGKAFIGYSDITALHIALNRRGLPTVHGLMVGAFGSEKLPWVTDSWLRAVAGEDPLLPDVPPATMMVGGVAEGELAGGCLTLIADSIGTPEAFDGANKIVLLEDVGERPHRVDAMLTHLVNAGVLDNAAGFVVGEMTNTDTLGDPGDTNWRDIVRERLSPFGKPTVIGFPFGHVEATLAMPLGRQVRLDADAGTLRMELEQR